jgi:2-polyprenyl-3-methyl-5-hydroxy-6-metoxy-1,4-benzoquinol methylase
VAEGHEWAKDCEKCSKCGKIRRNKHTWKDGQCSACGKTRVDVTSHDLYITSIPTNQTVVDLIPGWTSAFPEHVGVKAGKMGLFNAGHVQWAISELGGVEGKRILELGPLEGGHTYSLLQAGAREVTAIEANSRAYMRCLISKELLHMQNASFLLGNFNAWMEQNNETFDIVWCSGVLYHQVDPIRHLELVAKTAPNIYVWTQYMDEDAMPEGDPRRADFVGEEIVSWRGIDIKLYRRAYGGINDSFCGGIFSNPAWIRRTDIVKVLEMLGFSRFSFGFDAPDHPNGPAFSFTAMK